jgi:hypothetical protein
VSLTKISLHVLPVHCLYVLCYSYFYQSMAYRALRFSATQQRHLSDISIIDFLINNYKYRGVVPPRLVFMRKRVVVCCCGHPTLRSRSCKGYCTLEACLVVEYSNHPFWFAKAGLGKQSVRRQIVPSGAFWLAGWRPTDCLSWLPPTRAHETSNSFFECLPRVRVFCLVCEQVSSLVTTSSTWGRRSRGQPKDTSLLESILLQDWANSIGCTTVG